MLNKIILHGRLGKDPEQKPVNGPNGTFTQVNFNLAVSRDFGDSTDWFYCVMFGKRAEAFARYCKKGQEVLVTGEMQSFKSTNDESRTLWSVKVNGFDFCGKKEQTTNTAEPLEVPEGFEELKDEDFTLF